MSHPIFERIVKEISAAAGAADNWEELAGNGLLRIDNVQMQMQSTGTEQAEQLLLYIDFGALPTERTPEFTRMLLDVNFMASVNNTRSFCTNPENGQVIGMLRMPLDSNTNGEQIIEVMRNESHIARTWQHEWPPANPGDSVSNAAHMFKV